MLRCFCLLGALLSLAAPAQELVLRTVQQAGSTVKYDPDGDPQRPGLCREILRAVEKQSPGLRFSGLDQQMPLKRVERMLSEGFVDAFFCLLKSPERERQMGFLPVPLYRIHHAVVQRADDPHSVGNLVDLAALSRDKPVLVARGTVLARRLAAADVAIAEVASEREAVRMLALGRADAIYGQDINLQRYIGDAHLGDRLRVSRGAFPEEDEYVGVRFGLPEAQAERLTQALRQLERDGTLRQLAEKYR